MKSTSYSEKTLDHFRNPRNVGTLEGADVAMGRVGNPVCGDLMEMYIRVGPGDRIEDVRFQTFGCGSAVATSSMITELVKGMTLDDALKVTRSDVADALDGLPPIKMHCSNLAADALHAAIANWRAGVRPEEVGTSETAPECAVEAQPPVPTGEIAGFDAFLGFGAYREVGDVEDLRDKRVIVVDRGDRSAQLAIDLSDVAARVVFMTPGKELATLSQAVRIALKLSDVKVLLESEPLEVLGEGEVERVRVHDLNEDDEYELVTDAVIVPG